MQDNAFVEEVLAKCEALRDSHLWPGEQKMNPRRWLLNFAKEDRAVAAAILNQVTFLSADAVERILRLAFSRLQENFIDPSGERKTNIKRFQDHLDVASFCPIEGEHPNPTDSGNQVSRLFRDKFGIPEQQILKPQLAIAEAERGAPLYLVDDCIGSGAQVVTMWTREYEPVQKKTLASVHTSRPFPAAVVCAIATEDGVDRIQKRTPLKVFAGHVLSARNSIRALPNLPQLPNHHPLADHAIDLLRRTAPRLLFPQKPHMTDEATVFGFNEMGFSLIFEHGCPDWSLPVLWASGDRTWAPLFEA